MSINLKLNALRLCLMHMGLNRKLKKSFGFHFYMDLKDIKYETFNLICELVPYKKRGPCVFKKINFYNCLRDDF